MQIYGMFSSYSVRFEGNLRRGNEDSDPEKDETNSKEKTRIIVLQPHLIVLPHLSPKIVLIKVNKENKGRTMREESIFLLQSCQVEGERLRIKYYYLIIYSLPQMKYLAAYALLTLSGKKDISNSHVIQKQLTSSHSSEPSDPTSPMKTSIDALRVLRGSINILRHLYLLTK
mgnify:CR=1 FL=1